jgi:hypothetical protein
MKRINKFGLALLLLVALLLIGRCVGAETLTMYPAHVPFKASSDEMNPAWVGLIVTIGAILFMWSVYELLETR